VFGFGGVGQAIARRLLAARAEVVVVRRTPRAPALRERELAAPSVDLAAGRDLLSTVDIAVLALPLTPETRGCFDAEALRRLRDGCILVNVARGALLDESSLEAHVARLGGVGLDVFETEPLPSEHWLWRHPKVIVTAHVARSPDAGAPAWLGLVEQNLAAYVAGAPLLHVVDKERGY
jgi:phosphoglycerate dehydrogenase-like enzyme